MGIGYHIFFFLTNLDHILPNEYHITIFVSNNIITNVSHTENQISRMVVFDVLGF